MIGTLIGDLAACTFKQDKTMYEKILIGEKAFFSDKGLLALATADALYLRDAETPELFKAVVKEYHDCRDASKVFFPKWFKDWCSPDNQYHWDSDSGMSLPMCCIAAPIDMNLSRRLHWMMLSGKASGYAAYYFSVIIRSLKNGISKEQTFSQDDVSMLPAWVDKGSFCENDPYNAINSLVLAWKAFDASYDYTSAVKNAASLGEYADTRVVTMLAATMAEVFYHSDFSNFVFPAIICEMYGNVIRQLKSIDADEVRRKRIEVELVATHSF